MDALEFIRDPDKWPTWPILPMKRRYELGFFFNDMLTNNHVVFYVGNIYERDKAIQQDVSPEQLLAEGWKVD